MEESQAAAHFPLDSILRDIPTNCHLAEIYRLYIRLSQINILGAMDFVSQKRSSLFHFTICLIFPSLTHHFSDLGSFLWPHCSNNKTHGTTGAAAASVQRSFFGVPSWHQICQSQAVWSYQHMDQVLKLMACQIRCCRKLLKSQPCRLSRR